jgi:hypothetical protein
MEGLEEFEEEEEVSHVRVADVAAMEEAHEEERRFNEVLAEYRHHLKIGKRFDLYRALAQAYKPVEGKEDPPLLR